MYKCSSSFMKRLPASRFWRDYAPVYKLYALDDEELQLAALTDAVVGRHGSRITMDKFSDHEICSLLLLVRDKGLLDGPMGERLAETFEQKLGREGADISLSEFERGVISSAVNAAAIAWRRH